MGGAKVAVLIPCRDEEAAVGAVVDAFREALPKAECFVFDNASSDTTADVALAHGATLRQVPEPGKGNVVRRMFADVEADVYLLVDGDGTYDAAIAPRLVELVLEGNDLVNARRVPISANSHRHGHELGNRLLTGAVARLFGPHFEDMLSGYKALSRRCVKSFPIFSRGFDVETELTVHALELHMAVAEVDGDYAERSAGSASKLSTVRDGWLISRTILRLTRELRPLAFFGTLGTVLIVVAFGLALPLIETYAQTGLVPRFPTAFLTIGLVILGALCVLSGLILETTTRSRLEAKVLHYLLLAGPRRDD